MNNGILGLIIISIMIFLPFIWFTRSIMKDLDMYVKFHDENHEKINRLKFDKEQLIDRIHDLESQARSEKFNAEMNASLNRERFEKNNQHILGFALQQQKEQLKEQHAIEIAQLKAKWFDNNAEQVREHNLIEKAIPKKSTHKI